MTTPTQITTDRMQREWTRNQNDMPRRLNSTEWTQLLSDIAEIKDILKRQRQSQSEGGYL